MIVHSPFDALHFDTLQKAPLLAQRLVGKPMRTASPVTHDIVEQYHDPRYAHALETGFPLQLARTAGLGYTPQYRDAIYAMAGAMMGAVAHTLAHSAHTFALTSGAHHAKYHHGEGFCAINSVAMGAIWAVEHTPEAHVWIIDVDSHAGGGTNDMLVRYAQRQPELAQRIHHLDIVVNQFDCYEEEREQDIPMYVEEADDYLRLLAHGLKLIQQPRPIRHGDVVIVNAGVDVHEDCDIGGLEGITVDVLDEREAMIRHLVTSTGALMVGLLAGGYKSASLSMNDVLSLHERSICSLLGLSYFPRTGRLDNSIYNAI